MPVDVGTPFRALDQFKEEANQALNSITRREQFKIQSQKQAREDALLNAVASHVSAGKDIYDPTVAPLAMALAGTSHAAALPYLEGMSKANAPKTAFAREGSIPGYFDRNGKWVVTGEQSPYPAKLPSIQIKETPLPNKNGLGQIKREGINVQTGETAWSNIVDTIPKETAEKKLSDKDAALLKKLQDEKNTLVNSFPHQDYNLNDLIINGLPPATAKPNEPPPDLSKGDITSAVGNMLVNGPSKAMPDDARKHAENALKSIQAYQSTAKRLGVPITPVEQYARLQEAKRLENDPKGDKAKAQFYKEDVARMLLKETGGDKEKARALADERGYDLK